MNMKNSFIMSKIDEVMCYAEKNILEMIKIVKTGKVLILFYRLWQGERVSKQRFMNEFKIGERTFERYLQEIRSLLADCYSAKELCFDSRSKTYYISDIIKTRLKGTDILPLMLILLGSQAFLKSELKEILTLWLSLLSRSERSSIETVIRSMNRKYTEPEHQKLLLKLISDLSYCIHNRQKICLHYNVEGDEETKIKVQPLQIIFSESYFYLTALEESHIEPQSYRLDKITSFDLLETVASKKNLEIYL